MTVSDKDLIDACNNGSSKEAEQAFATLYERHKAFVIRVAQRFVSDNDMALDALQETFAYLLRKFPPTGPGLTLTAELTTLLYPVAKNNAITLMRKANRFPSDPDQTPDDLPTNAPKPTNDISGIVADLSAERREVIQMRFVDEMSLQEIASALDIPLGTVKSRLHLAIKQLKESPNIKKTYFS